MTVNLLRDRRGRAYGRFVLAAVLGTGATAPSLWGFAEIAGGTVNLAVGASVTSDSNILGNSTETSDTFFSVSPTLLYSRARGRGTIDLSVGTSFNRYSDFDAEDSDDWSASGTIKLPTAQGARFSGDVSFSYFDGKQIDEALAARIQIRNYSASFGGTYQMTPKTGLRFGADYGRSSPEIRADNKSYTGRLGLSFPIRPQLATFLEYRVTKSSSEFDAIAGTAIDYTDHSVNLGLDGSISLTGKLTGSMAVGFQKTDAAAGTVGDGEDQLVASANLTWEARPRTLIGLTGEIGTQITNSIETYESSGLHLTVDQEIGQRWNADAALGWRHFTIRGRDDSDNDQVTGTAGLSYTATRYFSARVAVTHYVRWSPDPFSDIERTTFSLGGTFTF